MKRIFKTNKFKENKINSLNSTIGNQCVAENICIFRFTTMCQKCKNNIGKERYKNYFELKEN